MSNERKWSLFDRINNVERKQQAKDFSVQYNIDTELEDRDTEKKSTRKRAKQVCVRYTPEEYVRVERKIRKSGLSKNEYLVRMSLDGEVKSRSADMADDFLLDEIASIRTLIRQLGGLLKMIRAAAETQKLEDQRCADWMLKAAVTMQDLQIRIQNMEDRMNGNH